MSDLFCCFPQKRNNRSDNQESLSSRENQSDTNGSSPAHGNLLESRRRHERSLPKDQSSSKSLDLARMNSKKRAESIQDPDSPTEQFDMMSSAQALYNLKKMHREVKLGDMEFQLSWKDIQSLPARGETPEPNMAYVAGKGGFKKAYQLPDGRAMILLNLENLGFPSAESESAQYWAKRWSEAVQEEKDMADKVLRAGLQAQQIEIQNLQVGDASVPVMVAPSFEFLETQGMQVRDAKNRKSSSYGNSMIFGSFENAANPERLKLAMKGLLDDTVKIMVNGMSFPDDSYNLVIQDTPETLSHDRSQLGLFDERKQEIHLFFFDFSSKHGPQEDQPLAWLDTKGKPNPAKISSSAYWSIVNAFSALNSGISEKELQKIEDGSDQYVRNITSSQFDQIKDDLVKDVTKRVIAGISALPMKERLKRFSSE